MPDYNSQLPIRSKDDSDERVLVKVQDGDLPGGANETMTVSEKKAHVRLHAKDSDSVDQEVLLSQEGHVQSNGDYDATSNKRPSSQGLIASDRSASPDETTMNKRPTAIPSTDGDNAVAQDVAIRDSQGNHIDEENPLPVYQAESPGEEIDVYDEASSVAKDATANHDYTVSGGVQLKSIEAEACGSGLARFELQVETGVASGVFNPVMTKLNSTAKPDVEFKYAVKVAAGVRVRVEKTNLDNQPQNLYSQIRGLEI